MGTNVESFNADVTRFANGNERVFKIIRDKLGFQGLRGVVLKTAVDKGRARGNWQVSEGSPAQGELDVVDKNGGATITNGNGKIAAAATFGVLYTTNNVPYIEALENGHSQQHPDGMLGLTFEELKAQF